MDAALKVVFAFRQTRELDSAALKKSSPGYLDLRKAAGAFGDGGFCVGIKLRDEAAAELRHLGKGVRLAALVDYADRGSLLDPKRIRFKVPLFVGMSRLCLCKQVVQRGECSKRDVLAEVCAKRLIEGGRIAFVQGHDLGHTRWSQRWICLRKRQRRAC